MLFRLDTSGIQRNDLAPDLDDQLRKRSGISSARLERHVSESRIALQRADVVVNRLCRSGQRGIDTFLGDEDSSLQTQPRAELPLFRGEGDRFRNGNIFVEEDNWKGVRHV